MTTTISVATNNCIVIGCDSLGTISIPSVRSWELNNLLFDEDGNSKTDELGMPIRLTKEMLESLSRSLPTNQMPSVTKIFPLADKVDAGLLFAGLASLGNKSLRTIIGEFIESAEFKNWKREGCIMGLTKCLAKHINAEYKSADEWASMEIIVSGYSKSCREPEINKVLIARAQEPKISEENKRGEFKVVFGGQFDVIQRVVDGIDLQGWGVFVQQAEIALNKYRAKLTETLSQNGYTEPLPKHGEYGDIIEFFEFPFAFAKLSSEVRFFSEQAAIDFVEFLVELMIKSQQFSDQIPTVGGDIHIGLIIASEGFKWISKEHYKSREHSVPKNKEK